MSWFAPRAPSMASGSALWPIGVGKTLSLAASAMISALLNDGPILILCPSTLTVQWQVEMMDKLGIPSAVWSSTKKEWIDPKGHIVKTRGPEDIKRCPFRIAIVSTGLIVHDSEERRYLLECKYGSVVLDEAHKARRHGGLGPKKDGPNNLLDFMLRIGPRTRNLLLGTATPIQTEVRELWDLLRILNAGADFVFGRELFDRWSDWERALPVVKGEETPGRVMANLKTSGMRELLARSAAPHELKHLTEVEGMQRIQLDATAKVAAGITSADEVRRVLGGGSA